MVMVSKVF